jgi:hypothetical protein
MTIRGWAEFPALEFPFGAADAWRAITMHDLPASSHGKPVDVFDTAAALEIELRRAVKGEVRFFRVQCMRLMAKVRFGQVAVPTFSSAPPGFLQSWPKDQNAP